MEETVDIINQWIDEQNDPAEDVVDDLHELNGQLDDVLVDDDPGNEESANDVIREEKESDDDQQEEPVVGDENVPPRFRKYLTIKRPVNSQQYRYKQL